jgi:hypothetical protein
MPPMKVEKRTYRPPKGLTLDRNSTAVWYTPGPITCTRCGTVYTGGFMTEIKNTGLYCTHCLKPAFEEYFQRHPGEEFFWSRGIYSLAYQQDGKGTYETVWVDDCDA